MNWFRITRFADVVRFVYECVGQIMCSRPIITRSFRLVYYSARNIQLGMFILSGTVNGGFFLVCLEIFLLLLHNVCDF